MSSEIPDRLAAAGLSPGAAENRARLLARVSEAMGVSLGGEVHGWFVPGRIEVLGKHTDYAGGRSLLCAAERGMCVVASAAADRRVSVRDVALDREMEFEIGPDLKIADTGWANYVTTVARRLARNFPGTLNGARITIASDLPRAAGMSSSSVLMISVYLALAEVNRLRERPEYQASIHREEDLAAYLACIENGQSFGTLAGDRGVGTFGGSEDHTAILCCRAGELSQYRFCPVVQEEQVPLPAGLVFAIAASGIASDKTGSAREQYNRASRSAAAVLAAWRKASGRDDATLFAACMHAPDAPDRIRQVLESAHQAEFSPRALLARFEQFHRESCKIIPAAVVALRSGDLAAFGKLVDESQRGAEQGLHNQVPETLALARSARRLGAHAASAFGAGFGGSVWALIAAEREQEFLRDWRYSYSQRFPGPAARSTFFSMRPGQSVMRL